MVCKRWFGKEYGIDLNKYKTGGYEQCLMHATKYIKEKRKKESINFLLCDGGALKPIQENCVVGYIDKMDKRGNAEVKCI